MIKSKKTTIEVQGTSIVVLSQNQHDVICLTDIAKFKNPAHPDDVIRNWLRNRNTVEFLGVWERLKNSSFNPVEFDGIRIQSGLNSFVLTPKQWIEEADLLNVALFGQTAKQWRDANAKLEGNMREYATIEQLLVLANIEGMNAEFIHMALSQMERLKRLNEIAIRQMQVLTSTSAIKKLKGK